MITENGRYECEVEVKNFGFHLISLQNKKDKPAQQILHILHQRLSVK